MVVPEKILMKKIKKREKIKKQLNAKNRIPKVNVAEQQSTSDGIYKHEDFTSTKT